MRHDRAHQAALAADERTMLLAFLDYHRDTLRMKTDGPGRRAARHDAAAVDLTLGGMLKHMALVEDWWFGVSLGGRPPTPPFDDVDWEADADWDWHSAAGDAARGAAAALFDRSSTASDQVITAADLDRAIVRRAVAGRPARADQPALDPGAHDRGVRPAQRPRRPDPRVDRRRDGRVTIRPATADDWPQIWPFFARDRRGRRDLRLPRPT